MSRESRSSIPVDDSYASVESTISSLKSLRQTVSEGSTMGSQESIELIDIIDQGLRDVESIDQESQDVLSSDEKRARKMARVSAIVDELAKSKTTTLTR